MMKLVRSEQEVNEAMNEAQESFDEDDNKYAGGVVDALAWLTDADAPKPQI